MDTAHAAQAAAADAAPGPCADAPDAWKHLLAVHGMVGRQLDARMQRDHGITLRDYEALLHLGHADGGRMRMAELADRVQLTRSGVTRLVEGLCDAGYVRRATCDTDRRGAFAELTADGQQLMARAGLDHVAIVDELFSSHFTTAELDQLGDLLGRVAAGRTPCRLD